MSIWSICDGTNSDTDAGLGLQIGHTKVKFQRNIKRLILNTHR